MLTEELSTDLKWSTLTVNSTIVAADMVAMDSPLPLKKRDAIGTADGEIAKLGMKKQMSEKQLSDIDILVSKKVENKIIVEKIFNDAISCTMGILEKIEYIFLTSLSNGVGLVEDTENVGTGVRIDFGYKAANKFGVVKPWSDATSLPLDDIKNVLKAAKAAGVSLKFMMMDQSTFDNLADNAQTKQYFAFSQGFVGSAIPVPDLDMVNAMLLKRYKLTIVIVDRTVITERDGVRTVKTPWAANKVIFLETQKVGRLMYGILAEETRQSKAATYTKAGSFILLKKWSSEEPFAEYTSSQALAIPVIDAVDSIYSLDSEEAAIDAQTEGNSTFLYKTVSYTKASVADALKLAYPATKLTVASTDAKLLDAINKLSEEQILIFEANIVAA
jgi:hypothetical protein